MSNPASRAACGELDAADPLRSFRDRFAMPDGVVYFDGNSLGPLPTATPARVAQVVEREWGKDLISSWNAHDWIDYPRRIGDKIAKIVGAQPGEVIATDSTSVNLFKVLAAALKQNPKRRDIVSERDNFPTDLYMAQGLLELIGGEGRLKLVAADEILSAIDDRTAVVMLTHVNFKSGAMHDMTAVTRSVHDKGALMIWDLAHSAGAVPVDLRAADADFAVGCGYKYLNGGPGAPAFLYVAARHQQGFGQPLSGWMGHAAPFAFEPSYRPAEGVARYLSGTPQIISMAALEVGVDLLLEADPRLIWDKSQRQVDLFISLVEDWCGDAIRLVTPRKHDIRGSQASFACEDGYAVMQALIARNVIGDFRTPDVIRFGFCPLFVRFVDVWDAATTLRTVLAERLWDRPEYRQRARVT